MSITLRYRKSVRDLYRKTENSDSGYRNGHVTLGGMMNRKGSVSMKYIVLGLAALVALGAGAYILGGSQPGVTPATAYPDFNSKEPIPTALAVRDHATIAPLDPVKELGAGKYKIGDATIDTTDNVADIAVAYGGAEKVIKNSDKQINFGTYIYTDKKSLDDRYCSIRGALMLPNKPPVYDKWTDCDTTSIKFTTKDFAEIKPGLFYQKYSSLGMGANAALGMELKTRDNSASLIVPQNELIKYFKCNDNGERCQY